MQNKWSLMDIAQIIYAPMKVFAKIATRQSALIYVLLVSILFALPLLLVRDQVVNFTYEQLIKQNLEISATQSEQIVQSSFNVALILKVLSRGAVIIGIGIILGVVNWVGKLRGTFRRGMILAALVVMPVWISEMLRAIIALILRVNYKSITFGAGAVIPQPVHGWWAFILKIDPFMIWGLILLVLGYKYVFLKDLRRRVR